MQKILLIDDKAKFSDNMSINISASSNQMDSHTVHGLSTAGVMSPFIP